MGDIQPSVLNLLFLGKRGFGKTTLTQNCVENSHDVPRELDPDMKMWKRNMCVGENHFQVKFWDIESLDSSNAIKSIFPLIDAVIIVFDETSRKSFTELQDLYYFVRKDMNIHTPIYIIGTKDKEESAIPVDEVLELSYALNVQGIVLSGQTGFCVSNAFPSMLQAIMRQKGFRVAYKLDRVVPRGSSLRTREKKESNILSFLKSLLRCTFPCLFPSCFTARRNIS